MNNLFRLRRQLNEFEMKVRRLQQAERELSSLAARPSSAHFGDEMAAISLLVRNPRKVDEVEERVRVLAKEIDYYDRVNTKSKGTEGDLGLTSRGSSPRQMASPVFISYSAVDTEAACAACSSLESRGITCWMATRDIVPGQNWAEAVAKAIDDAEIMVLVLSSASNSSSQVFGEVNRASAKDIPIIVVRLESVPLSRPLELFLGKRHWLDATKTPFQACLDRLADSIQRLVSTAE